MCKVYYQQEGLSLMRSVVDRKFYMSSNEEITKAHFLTAAWTEEYNIENSSK